MEKDFVTPEKTDEELESGKRVTAFSAIKQNYGLQIEVAGCVCMQAAHNDSKDVIGIVKLDDQVVPILDSRKAKGNTVSDQACIVLFENVVNQTTIVTGRLYENACRVFDLIVECMDAPETHDHLYAVSEHHHFCETNEQ